MKFIVSYDKHDLTKEEIINADKNIDKICTNKTNEIFGLIGTQKINFKYEGRVEIPNKGVRQYLAYIVEDNFKDFHLL